MLLINKIFNILWLQLLQYPKSSIGYELKFKLLCLNSIKRTETLTSFNIFLNNYF